MSKRRLKEWDEEKHREALERREIKNIEKYKRKVDEENRKNDEILKREEGKQ